MAEENKAAQADLENQNQVKDVEEAPKPNIFRRMFSLCYNVTYTLTWYFFQGIYNGLQSPFWDCVACLATSIFNRVVKKKEEDKIYKSSFSGEEFRVHWNWGHIRRELRVKYAVTSHFKIKRSH